MSDLVLQLKQINKYFGRSHVIKDVNIDFEKGAFRYIPRAVRLREDHASPHGGRFL